MSFNSPEEYLAKAQELINENAFHVAGSQIWDAVSCAMKQIVRKCCDVELKSDSSLDAMIPILHGHVTDKCGFIDSWEISQKYVYNSGHIIIEFLNISKYN